MKNLTILSREKHPTKSDPRYDLYNCICNNCGREFKANAQNVNSGKTKSCGKGKCHSHFKDIIGKKFGYLKVIGLIEGTAKWKLKCICGKEKIYYAGYLRRMRTRSCGCMAKKIWSDKSFKGSYSIIRNIFNTYKVNARKRNISFRLGFKYFKKLIQDNCFYCGISPSTKRIIKRKLKTAKLLYNGIDRINSNIGYSKKNCISCCASCNLAKRSMTVKEFLDWALRVVNFNKLGVNNESSCFKSN